MRFKKATITKSQSYKIPVYDNTRKYMIPETMTAMSIATLTTASFLAGFLKYLGVDSTTSAIIMQLPLIACVAQLFSPNFYEGRKHRLRFVWIFSTIHRAILSLIGFVVILVPTLPIKITVFTVLILTSYAFCYMAEGSWVEFMSNIVPAKLRGRYLAKRDAFMICASTATSLVMGYILDYFRDNDAEGKGFVLVFIMVGLLMVVNSICVYRMKQPPVHTSKRRISPVDVIKKPLANARYRKFIVFYAIYCFSIYIALSYFSIYFVTNLKASYTYIAAMSLLSTVSRMLSARLWSKLPSKFSWPTVLALSLATIGVCHIFWGLATRQNMYFILPIAHTIGGIGWGGLNVAMLSNNILFAPKMQRPMYFSFNALTGAIIGFLSALFGAWLCKMMTAVKLDLGFFTVGNVQIIFIISALFLLLNVVYIMTVMKKEAESDA